MKALVKIVSGIGLFLMALYLGVKHFYGTSTLTSVFTTSLFVISPMLIINGIVELIRKKLKVHAVYVMKDLLPYIKDKLEVTGVTHEVHEFESGTVMIDVFTNNEFHVIQIDGDTIGFSKVTEETAPFDIIPDKLFHDPELFKKEFEAVLKST